MMNSPCGGSYQLKILPKTKKERKKVTVKFSQTSKSSLELIKHALKHEIAIRACEKSVRLTGEHNRIDKANFNASLSVETRRRCKV